MKAEIAPPAGEGARVGVDHIIFHCTLLHYMLMTTVSIYCSTHSFTILHIDVLHYILLDSIRSLQAPSDVSAAELGASRNHLRAPLHSVAKFCEDAHSQKPKVVKISTHSVLCCSGRR